MASNITLSRVLAALESQIQDEQSLRSPYNLKKLSQNLEYARSILLRLEHDSTSIKIASRKQTVQSDLHKKREQIKRLQARLQDLNQLQYDDNSDADGSEDEIEAPEPQNDSVIADTEADSALRARKPGALSTGNALSTAREALFTTSAPSITPSTLDREALLLANRTEQEDLTSSLLTLARDLKHSSIHFSTSLESEKDILDRAGSGLDTNVSGLESASRKMSGLRRLSEGTGWWGRIVLYAYIAGLWLLALVLVLGLPKLRL